MAEGGDAIDAPIGGAGGATGEHIGHRRAGHRRLGFSRRGARLPCASPTGSIRGAVA